MATSWNMPLLQMFDPSIGPWPAYAAYRVLQYVDEDKTEVAETRLVSLPGDPIPRTADVRRAFLGKGRPLAVETCG
jgi:hypothetical protein